MFKVESHLPLIIATDGAKRKCGLSVGAAYIREPISERGRITYKIERDSTHQRGELYGMLLGLTLAESVPNTCYIVTDSEYVFFMLYKRWYINWERKGWITTEGEPVKNQDIIKQIVEVYERVEHNVSLYHIKGHVIPFGKVTTARIMNADPTGFKFYQHAFEKFANERHKRQKAIDNAMKLFETNMGYAPPMHSFIQLLVSNMVVDAAATTMADRHVQP